MTEAFSDFVRLEDEYGEGSPARYLQARAAFYEAKSAEREARRMNELLRPSVLLEAGIEEHVDHEGETYFVAFLGEVFAEPADSPDEAFANFDKLWMRGRESFYDDEVGVSQ